MPPSASASAMPRPRVSYNDVVEYDATVQVPTDAAANEAPYIIHNTFIDYPAPRSPSLEEFIQPRLCKSLPCSGIEEVPWEMKAMVQAKPPTTTPQSTAIHLAELLPSELPSAGSQGHHEGSCKPCAFFWADVGCKNGSACDFCHLCDSGTKRRRTKEKRKFRAMMKLQQTLLGRVSVK